MKLKLPIPQALSSGALVHLAIACVFALNALAWAWHVDIPMEPAEGQAQIAGMEHAHLDGGDLVDRCDHCCHAGAHLVALIRITAAVTFNTPHSYSSVFDARLVQQKTDPPYIPPIV